MQVRPSLQNREMSFSQESSHLEAICIYVLLSETFHSHYYVFFFRGE